MKALTTMLLLASAAIADGPGVIISRHAKTDFELTADPDAKQWKGVTGVFAETSPLGKPEPDFRTEIRSRWTGKYLYFLYICPYKTLYLKPNPSTTTETNKLWDWDVGEAFLGWNFKNIDQYKEFEVSPQGEWVDLDIDRKNPKPEGGWLWNSGFEVKTRIDRAKQVWYAEMKIPFNSISPTPPHEGLELRANLYRIEGPEPNRTYITWQPTGEVNYHVPKAFGKLSLGK